MGGRSLADVNMYERHVLDLLDFKLNIKSHEWSQWVSLYKGNSLSRIPGNGNGACSASASSVPE